jgi:hypothetical protein
MAENVNAVNKQHSNILSFQYLLSWSIGGARGKGVSKSRRASSDDITICKRHITIRHVHEGMSK